jgi:hypothetical protein
VSHSLICGQDEPGQQPNQRGGLNAVADAAKLRVIDNAVLSDSSRSKDTYLGQAHPSVTWLRCVHQFDSRFSQFVRSQMKFDLSNSCGHDAYF